MFFQILKPYIARNAYAQYAITKTGWKRFPWKPAQFMAICAFFVIYKDGFCSSLQNVLSW